MIYILFPVAAIITDGVFTWPAGQWMPKRIAADGSSIETNKGFAEPAISPAQQAEINNNNGIVLDGFAAYEAWQLQYSENVPDQA